MVAGDLFTVGRILQKDPARAFEAFHRGCFATDPVERQSCGRVGFVCTLRCVSVDVFVCIRWP
jgi:hypothetical protein